MNWICTIYVAVLFFVLTPGVLLSLPPKSSKLVVAATHAVVFALIWHFTHKIVWRMSVGHEGFKEGYNKNKITNGSYKPGELCGDSVNDSEGNNKGGTGPNGYIKCVKSSDNVWKWTKGALDAKGVFAASS
jgi:hypothetical protein